MPVLSAKVVNALVGEVDTGFALCYPTFDEPARFEQLELIAALFALRRAFADAVAVLAVSQYFPARLPVTRALLAGRDTPGSRP